MATGASGYVTARRITSPTKAIVPRAAPMAGSQRRRMLSICRDVDYHEREQEHEARGLHS